MLQNLFLSIVVAATIDSTSIVIGDQTDLHLQATLDREAQVEFPTYDRQIIDGLEVVDKTVVDTVRLKDGKVQLNQYLTLTSFRDSLFIVRGIPFVADGDTIWSAPISLNVIQPFEIDSAQAITDIKGIQKAPIWWWGIIRWVLLAIAVIGAGIGIWYLSRFFSRKPKAEQEAVKEPERPAEEVALEKLERIKAEKKWQEGKTKEYHTELTDTVREYIGGRFGIHSSEKTSDDTLRELKPVMQEQKDLYERLRKMLQLADLVKFAKWTATPDENETALRIAYDFVNETTPAPEPETPNQKS